MRTRGRQRNKLLFSIDLVTCATTFGEKLAQYEFMSAGISSWMQIPERSFQSILTLVRRILTTKLCCVIAWEQIYSCCSLQHITDNEKRRRTISFSKAYHVQIILFSRRRSLALHEFHVFKHSRTFLRPGWPEATTFET